MVVEELDMIDDDTHACRICGGICCDEDSGGMHRYDRSGHEPDCPVVNNVT